ncbi:MAG: pentapeptide repeat-containing protein [Alphaproteobacteria bacterium]
MNYYALKTYTDKKRLHEGYFETFTQCIEDAVKKNIDLNHVDLRGENLSNANIDGAIMNDALFESANLTGANMSECLLNNSNFQNCTIYNTCFAYSDMNNVDFTGASFGATLIDGCNLKDCLFSTLSSLDLNFSLTASMQGCQFTEENGQTHPMSAPPIILKGFISTPIVIFDETVKIGNNIFSNDIAPALLKMMDNVLQSTCPPHQKIGA